MKGRGCGVELDPSEEPVHSALTAFWDPHAKTHRRKVACARSAVVLKKFLIRIAGLCCSACCSRV